MSTASSTTHAAPSQLQVTAVAWIVGSVPVAAASVLLLALSESTAGVLAGAVLAVLTVAAWAVAAWLLRRPERSARFGSLAVSAAWLVGALVVLPGQEFLLDALWAAGVPALVAVVTAVLAARRA